MVIAHNDLVAQNSNYDNLIKEGKFDLDNNRTLNAIDKFTEAYALSPTCFNAPYYLGLSYLKECQEKNKDCKLCIEFLNKALGIDSNKENIHYALGRCKGLMHDFTGALIDLNIAIQKHPDTSGYTSRALLEVKLNDLNGACWDFYLSSKLGSVLSKKMFEKNCGIKDKK